ncbi:MAG TPA: YceI family protein [Bacteroidia bacterium]
MKKGSIFMLAAVVTMICGFAVSSLWNVANENVAITFELPEEGTKGTVSGLKASIDFDEKHPESAKINASIDIRTLNTGNKKKDDHLLSADFFNAEKYPAVSFSSTSVKAAEHGFIASGNLTMKDSTKAVEIPFTFEGKDGAGAFKGTMTIHSGDFGVTKASKSGKDKVVVTLTIPVKK